MGRVEIPNKAPLGPVQLFFQSPTSFDSILNGDLPTIYYLGVIDILTPYNTFKRIEHVWKGMSADRHKISPVPPPEYASRFLGFLNAVMRGGGGAQRFKPGVEKPKEKVE